MIYRDTVHRLGKRDGRIGRHRGTIPRLSRGEESMKARPSFDQSRLIPTPQPQSSDLKSTIPKINTCLLKNLERVTY